MRECLKRVPSDCLDRSLTDFDELGRVVGARCQFVAARRRCGGPGAASLHAFTLVELMVVIGIIAILTVIAVPAVGPAMMSNYKTQVSAALGSAMVTAQTAALGGTDAGIRIERAFATDEYERMVDVNGNHVQDVSSGLFVPKYLDYQRIRLVQMGPDSDAASWDGGANSSFQVIRDSKTIDLPTGVWLAPANFYTRDVDNTNDFGPFDICVPTQYRADPCAGYTSYGSNLTPARFAPFDTFYVVFNRNGTVKRFDRDDLTYIDPAQKVVDSATGNEFNMYVRHAQDSAQGVIMYERTKLDNAPATPDGVLDFLRREGQAMFFNRYLGTVIKGE